MASISADSILSAGVSTSSAPHDNTASCLQLEERPSTPENVRKWRRSGNAEPGAHVLHPGIAADVKGYDQQGKRVFGVSTKGSDHVDDVWHQQGTMSEYQEIKHEMAEKTYYRAKREPLGASYVRDQKEPHPNATDPKFRYGIPTKSSEDAKSLLYPDEKVAALSYLNKDQYKRSHNAFEPGEQKQRGYNWGGTSAQDRVFGRSGGVLPLNGVSTSIAEALRCEADEPPKRITAKKVEDYKGMHDTLGRAKNLGHGPRGVDPNFRYGQSTLGSDEWDAKACIEGDYSVPEQMPDRDLGKSITPGFRNVSTETRAFGVPSVRTDIPPYAKKSIADSQNYGDDVNARYLVQPGDFSNMGIEDSDFFRPQSRDEIRSLFSSIGYQYPDDIFEAMFAEATAPSGEVCVASFQDALNNYLAAIDEDTLPEW
eukprot:CAMPEP_0113937352 /NCGR_PEP_ID=MMETSP1339-20121228/3985_1 /TAXON_ID=94617 /ORGANISM="Fibrocapsa japonica" /LENGTH=425 /DNA_ID=CAMNT_0000940077 /DNA_START=106 /DNA_END=1380 /DNA_ORIENTATION=+ /assembly_acc=CAM_ASM_000762